MVGDSDEDWIDNYFYCKFITIFVNKGDLLQLNRLIHFSLFITVPNQTPHCLKFLPSWQEDVAYGKKNMIIGT